MNLENISFDHSDAIDGLVERSFEAFRPPERLTVSEWAVRHRRLSPEGSAFTGRFRLESAPYQKEPMEAVKTNIIGTENMLNSAIKNNVEKVICLSTDKAVYPINAMGVSKSLMEKVFVAKSRLSSKIKIIGTRYGNVMASRGSVIPLFYNQIKDNKPITITDPNMTRFMMSLDNAVELVLYAFQNGKTGDIFVQKAPSNIVIVQETSES